MREALSFAELEHRLLAMAEQSVSIQVVTECEIPAFLDGTIDSVMRFEASESHGLLLEGAGGAWTVQLAEPEFVSATLTPIPPSGAGQQLMIRMRDHRIVIDPGDDSRVAARSEHVVGDGE